MSVLRAADGLELHVDAHGACRIAWGEADWFGPAGLTIVDGGRIFRGAQSQAPESIDLAAPQRDEISGRDELGAFRALELRWHGLPYPLRTTVHAYLDRSLLVFRIEARNGIAGGGSGSFATPSVAWPHFAPLARQAGGVAEGAASYAHQWTEFALPVFGDAN